MKKKKTIYRSMRAFLFMMGLILILLGCLLTITLLSKKVHGYTGTSNNNHGALRDTLFRSGTDNQEINDLVYRKLEKEARKREVIFTDHFFVPALDIIGKTGNMEMAVTMREFWENHYILIPDWQSDRLVLIETSTPKSSASIGILILTEEDGEINSHWKEKCETVVYETKIDDPIIITLNSTFHFSSFWSGLPFLSELFRAKGYLSGGEWEKCKEEKTIQKLQRWLIENRYPEYRRLIEEETNPTREYYNLNPDYFAKRLEQIFGPPLSEFENGLRCLIFSDHLLLEIDEKLHLIRNRIRNKEKSSDRSDNDCFP